MDSAHDQARLFYLVLLGMVVAVGLFARYRGRLGQAAQHAAIWALIFIGGVLAVGFLSDLERILTGGPQQVDGETLALTRQADGHFHARVEVNGTDIPFIVDTGATHMVLSQRDAARAGLDARSLDFQVPSQTANGVVMSAPVRLDRVEFGQFVDHDVPAMVNGGALNVSLLGMRYLERFSSLRVEGDRMYLSR